MSASRISNQKHPAFPAIAHPTVPGSHIHLLNNDFGSFSQIFKETKESISPPETVTV